MFQICFPWGLGSHLKLNFPAGDRKTQRGCDATYMIGKGNNGFNNSLIHKNTERLRYGFNKSLIQDNAEG